MADEFGTLFVSSFGSGRPVLCLHGIESHGMRFLGLAARVPALRVVAPDLRGHGRSPKGGPWTLEQHLVDLRPLLASLAVDGQLPLVLGHSYGGLLAWELARSAPTAISGLVLVDPAIAVTAQVAAASMAYESSYLGHSWADEREAFEFMAARHPASGAWAAALDVAVALDLGADGR